MSDMRHVEAAELPVRFAINYEKGGAMVSSLAKAITFETVSGEYVADAVIGEGGSGRVYGAKGSDGSDVAIKVLTAADKEKRRRFKNEINFGSQNEHKNVVTIIDKGLLATTKPSSPFYVAHRYDGNLRTLMQERGIQPDTSLSYFTQVLNGIEAAHLKGVIHRDLKPENILYDRKVNLLAIGDFGIARFTEELLATAVRTDDSKRLANFVYAAPEQRSPGAEAWVPADIYALGLILNEMFTGTVPHGTGFQTIANVAKEFGFLDPIVAQMLSQSPAGRPQSIADVKSLIMKHRAEAVSLQKLSEISNTVIKVTDVDDPLALVPPRLVNADWNNGTLTLTLDRPVTQRWVQALHKMRNYSSVAGKGPEIFNFSGNSARVNCDGRQAQQIIDYFKAWLPIATRVLKQQLEDEARQREARERAQLQAQKKRRRGAAARYEKPTNLSAARRTAQALSDSCAVAE